VLNRNWQPVHVATVARALVMLWNESARVVDPSDYQTYTWEDWSKLRPAEGERFIRAVRFRLRVPEVITLTDYDRLPAATVSFSRRNIFKRDHYTCQYCGDRGSGQLGEGSRRGKSVDNSIPHYQGNRPRRQPGYAIHQQRIHASGHPKVVEPGIRVALAGLQVLERHDHAVFEGDAQSPGFDRERTPGGRDPHGVRFR
jgi:5-methylcytosine-specific restriction endonuclease McrA